MDLSLYDKKIKDMIINYSYLHPNYDKLDD
jgi:hypothetical protein